MAYKVVVCRSLSQAVSTGCKVGRRIQRHGDTLGDVYKIPQERGDGSKNDKRQPSTKIRESEQDTPPPPNNNNEKKEAHLKSPKLHKKGATRPFLYPPHRLHIHMPASCVGPGLSKHAGLRPECACWLWISIAMCFHQWRRSTKALERMTGLRGVSTTTWCGAHMRVSCGGASLWEER
jgi:hypothetical protein